MYHGTGSLFPLFPWAGFTLLGATFGVTAGTVGDARPPAAAGPRPVPGRRRAGHRRRPAGRVRLVRVRRPRLVARQPALVRPALRLGAAAPVGRGGDRPLRDPAHAAAPGPGRGVAAGLRGARGAALRLAVDGRASGRGSGRSRRASCCVWVVVMLVAMTVLALVWNNIQRVHPTAGRGVPDRHARARSSIH